MSAIITLFICSVIGLFLTFCSAICFSIPLLKDKKVIKELSTKFFGFGLNRKKEERLLRERKYAILGLVFLSLGFSLQMLAIFIQLFFLQ